MRRLFGVIVVLGSLCGAAAAAETSSAPADSAVIHERPSALAVQHVRVAFPKVRDEAAMVLVGTALIGLAAAVRRAA